LKFDVTFGKGKDAVVKHWESYPIKSHYDAETTEIELFSYYIKMGMDDIMSFPDYLEKFKLLGCKILED
jgi:hypothetical protein